LTKGRLKPRLVPRRPLSGTQLNFSFDINTRPPRPRPFKCPALPRLAKREEPPKPEAAKKAPVAAAPAAFGDEFGFEALIRGMAPTVTRRLSQQPLIEIRKPPPLGDIRETRVFAVYSEFLRTLTE
jgi:hypothetical protein